ncbi:MAG TPA: tetratricopeptide repeat protein [Gemmataceae bacterium]|jgi:lipoprotein NlpI
MRLSMLSSALLLVCLPVHVCAVDTADDLLQKAKAAWQKKQPDEAIKLAGKAIDLDPKNAEAFLMRGMLYEALDKHAEAVADFDQTLKLDPKAADAYEHRGSEQFKLGKIAESITDFDQYLKLKPKEEPKHWKRGISYYYAGRYEDGQKQFEAYQNVDGNDVENVVWRYLCMARAAGVEKARAGLLNVGEDKRVPLMRVYDLFAGKAKPEDVLVAVEEGKPSKEEMNMRLFYAHLYLGLYFEAAGDKKKTLEHMRKAVEDYPARGYMGDVARVHLELRSKEKTKP